MTQQLKQAPHAFGIQPFPINAEAIVEGDLVGFNESTGYATKWADTDGHKFVGVCVKTTTTSNAHVLVKCVPMLVFGYVGANADNGGLGDYGPSDSDGNHLGGIPIGGSFNAQGKVGDLVYCSSEDISDATLTAGNEPIGRTAAYSGTSGYGAILLIPRGYSLGSPTAWDGPVDLASTLNVGGVFTAEAAANFAGAVTVGEDDTGYDVTFYGATSGKKMLWDESADKLQIDGTLDVNGDLDLDHALTAAGDFANIAGTINHATANAEAVDAHITQLTTARSGGVVTAVKANTTSLAGDSGGLYNAFEEAHTDGGGSATHNFLYSAADSDNFLYASATGKGGAVVGAMTAKSPESDTEAGYLKISIGGTAYEIPFYATS